MSKKVASHSTGNNVSSSTKDYIPDSEDNEMNDIEIIQRQRKQARKSKSKKNNRLSGNGIVTITQIPCDRRKEIKDEDKEFIEYVLGSFHSFHKIQELKSFKNMISLTLIYEFIKDIPYIVDNLPNPSVLKYLCLNENEITTLNGIEKLTGLEELQLNYNQLTKIETNLLELKNLKKLWLSENKIEIIENVPITITNFWIANNLIKHIPDDFDKYTELEFFNFAGNFICDLKDLFILEKLKSLKKLYISDINFGENPICQFCNYRQIIIHILRNVELLDQIYVSPNEIKYVENLYIKKNIFHKNRIRQNHKVTKMIFQLMKTHKLFLINMKFHQVRFFSQRQKMLEYAKYEKVSLCTENETQLNDIEKEIEASNSKVIGCLEICEQMNKIFRNLKKYLSDLNDFFIVTNFYELESNGNYKLESGNLNLKWVKSCLDLMKYRLPKIFLEVWKFKDIIFNQIFKITNKKTKYIFDSLYDNLIDQNNKFGNEQKYFDFFFLVLPYEILLDRRKLLSFLFEESYEDKNFLLCDNFSFLDEYELKSSEKTVDNKYIGIICKCAYFEEMVEEISGDNLFFNTLGDIRNYLKEKAKNSKQNIIKLTIKNHNTNFFYYNLKGVIEPEYWVEYSYEKVDKEKEKEETEKEKNETGFISSFSYKLNVNNDYENIFNLCSQHLFNPLNKIKQYFCKETINKNSISKFGEFNELENQYLFFAKSSIIAFLNNCFKYKTNQDYLNEINKINEKIKDITDLKFQTNLIVALEEFLKKSQEDSDAKKEEKNDKAKNSNPDKSAINFGKLKEINLFNLDLTNVLFEKFLNRIKESSSINNDILNLTRNCEYLSVCKNKIEKIYLNKILEVFPNLMKIDISHNNINTITFTNHPTQKYSLSSIDISYNDISDFSNIITLISNFENLTDFICYGNPFSKQFEYINEKLIQTNLSSEEKEKMIKDYNDSVKNKKAEDLIIKINEDNSKINTTNKNFDYIYDCFSFNEEYHNFSDNIYFREKMHQENNCCTVMLSKKKLFCIPTIEGKADTQILYINLNKITKITNLSQFKELLELYIQNNKIKKIENIPESLKKLDISNNELGDLQGIEKAQKLEWFNFENNSIKSIAQIIKLPNIVELYCAGNFIKNPKECCQLGKLNKLQIIDITGNDVCRVVRDLRITMIFYCHTLKNFNRINVDEQERIKAKEYFTGKLTSEVLEKRLGVGYNTFYLTEIDLSSLKLKDEVNLFSKEFYPKLTKLNLSRNIFKSFDIFGKLPLLVELNLNYNLFTELIPKKNKFVGGKGLLGLPNLESLELAGNQLVNLTGIHYLKKLKILVLRENSLSKIECINHMECLTFLDVSFNKLRNCDRSNVGTLPSLQVFLCDNNYLKNINGFDKFTSVQSLSFENNKVPDFNSLEKLAFLENLKDLAVCNNPVTRSLNYRNTMIRMFPNLIKLDEREITNEEKEMIAMEMQMDGNGYEEESPEMFGVPVGDFIVQKKLVSANYNYNMQRIQDKGLKKVNYIQIGYMMPFALPNNLPQNQMSKGKPDSTQMQMPSLSKKSVNSNFGSNLGVNNCNLPQIKVNTTINKPISSDSKKRMPRLSSNMGSHLANVNIINNIMVNKNNISQPNKNRAGSIQPVGRGMNAIIPRQDYYSLLQANSNPNDLVGPSLNIEKFTPSRSGKNFKPKSKK